MDIDTIMNLDDIVENWAREEFEKDSKLIGALRKRGKKADSLIYVWRNDNITFKLQGDTEFIQTPNKSEDQMPKTFNQTVMKSTFNNYTDCEQKHAFRCERTTQEVEKVIMTNGFKIGGNLRVQLGVPNVANATIGINSELSLGINTETDKTRTQTWNSDSNIHVPKHKKVIAEMKVEEREFIGAFKSKIMISGYVVVDIKDEQSKEVIHTVRENIAKIIKVWSLSGKEKGSKGQKRNADHDVELSNGDTTAIWTVRGTCYFRYGVEQTIDTKSESLAEESTDNSPDCDKSV